MSVGVGPHGFDFPDRNGAAPARRRRRLTSQASFQEPKRLTVRFTPPCRECNYPLLASDRGCPRCAWTAAA